MLVEQNEQSHPLKLPLMTVSVHELTSHVFVAVEVKIKSLIRIVFWTDAIQ